MRNCQHYRRTKDWNSLAGIEEKALGTLLVGNSRPIVGRHARQHFDLQGGKSRLVRGLCGRYSFLSRSLYAISLSHKSCPLIHFFQAKIVRHLRPFAVRGLPFFSREGSQTRFTSPSWCRGVAPSRSQFPRNDQDQRLSRLDAPREAYPSALSSLRNRRRFDRKRRLDRRS
jgi:hypothetical protein